MRHREPGDQAHVSGQPLPICPSMYTSKRPSRLPLSLHTGFYYVGRIYHWIIIDACPRFYHLKWGSNYVTDIFPHPLISMKSCFHIVASSVCMLMEFRYLRISYEIKMLLHMKKFISLICRTATLPSSVFWSPAILKTQINGKNAKLKYIVGLSANYQY